MVRLKDQKLKQNFKCSSTPLSGHVFSHFHWYTLLSVIVWDHSFFRLVHRLFRLFWYLHASSYINANASVRERVLMIKSCLQFLLGKKLRTENVTGWLKDKFIQGFLKEASPINGVHVRSEEHKIHCISIQKPMKRRVILQKIHTIKELTVNH